ncbi:hypothetical protein GCM10011611_41290 [Aliidongia dinghuensis]|uniref:Uncharacterized protein n=1 Tax=Aliidongia dinghuensis TaxID=1867774 RepID=A0A8J2YXA5_9PROT|nr:hypothetical protein [Aliidongia dinghuensis]GGF30944.1 hypothetical protein GCM10011611_41290 [Aliidongia dinghuensis]
MGVFWVQESFTRSALWIHVAGCPRFNEGHVSNIIHGARWHGPFHDRDDAYELAAYVKRQGALSGPHSCPICRP